VHPAEGSVAGVWTYLAAAYGTSAILLGAFGAHGLRDRVSAEGIANWNTAASYHLAHALAILALALFASATGRSVTLPASLLAAGVLFFSGSIYLLVLTGQKWLGPVTPLGGLLMAAGWLALIPLARSAP
jgi:uncharacterized membrane protein YgdD (TMEM256/DUF423 family)